MLRERESGRRIALLITILALCSGKGLETIVSRHAKGDMFTVCVLGASDFETRMQLHTQLHSWIHLRSRTSMVIGSPLATAPLVTAGIR